MNKDTKVQTLGNTFYGSVTFNGPMFDIHDNAHVVIHQTREEQEAAPLTISDANIRSALEELLGFADEDGHRLFAQNNQWYAVFRVLSEQYDYPANMKEFCRVMTDMGMGEVNPPCKYECIKKVPAEMTQLGCKTALWHSYRNKATTQARKQIEVALKLMDLLSEKD